MINDESNGFGFNSTPFLYFSSLTLYNAFLCRRERNSLVLTAEQMTQKVLFSQAQRPQMAREPTSVLVKIPLPLDRLLCIVPFTTGSVQHEEKKDVFPARYTS